MGGIKPNIVKDIVSAARRIIDETDIAVLFVEQHLYFVKQADRYYAMQHGVKVINGPKSELSKAVIEWFLRV